MVRVALDAMGGDHGSGVLVDGARRAAAELGVTVQLVGRPAELQAILGADLPANLEIIAASEVVDMGEHPAMAVRQKKDSSVAVAHRRVSEGLADAAVSAGNSGACLAAAILILGRIRGVQRPALGSILPTATGYSYLLDVGANTDCRPEWLVQFAAMGSAYARRLMGIARPRVALLSNGEEAGKGSELVQKAHELLAATGVPGGVFIGNVEGKDLLSGKADVIVTDGFTGNVVIKTMEGTVEHVFRTIKAEVAGSLLAIAGGALMRPSLRRVTARADWREFGGAPLVGVSGVSVVAHGRSDARAIFNAIRIAAEAVRSDLTATIVAEIGAAAIPAAPAPVPPTAVQV